MQTPLRYLLNKSISGSVSRIPAGEQGDFNVEVSPNFTDKQTDSLYAVSRRDQLGALVSRLYITGDLMAEPPKIGHISYNNAYTQEDDESTLTEFEGSPNQLRIVELVRVEVTLRQVADQIHQSE